MNKDKLIAAKNAIQNAYIERFDDVATVEDIIGKDLADTIMCLLDSAIADAEAQDVSDKFWVEINEQHPNALKEGRKHLAEIAKLEAIIESSG